MLRWYGMVGFGMIFVFTTLVYGARNMGATIPVGQIAAYTSEVSSPDSSIRLGIALADMNRGLAQLLRDQSNSFSVTFPLSWSADGQELAFSGGGDIYVFSMADAEMRNVSQSPTYTETYPAWSSDGRTLAFVATSGNTTDNNAQYYLGLLDMESGQNSYHVLPEDVDYVTWKPVWASGSNLLAFGTSINQYKDDRLEIVRVEQGQLVPQLAQTGKDPAYPIWSPDGNWLAFRTYEGQFVEKDGATYLLSYNQIWIMDTHSGAIQVIAEDYENGPAWSPDSQQIAYTAWKRDTNPSYLALRVVDVKSGAQRLLTPAGYNDSLPSWSPDGRWIAVLSNRDGGNAVYQVDALNGEGQRLAAVEGVPSPSMPPLWSSDGQWLTVFTSKYISNTSTVAMTYVVAAANHTIALQLYAFQTIFAWQP